MATNAFKKSAKATQEKSKDNDSMAAGKQKSSPEQRPAESKGEEYATTSFRITKSRKTKLKKYAIDHDTTVVALLNAWIDTL